MSEQVQVSAWIGPVMEKDVYRAALGWLSDATAQALLTSFRAEKQSMV